MLARVPNDPPTTPTPPRPSRAGFTFVETAVTLCVLFVALTITFQMVSEMSKQRSINRERAEAAMQARNVIEDMRNLPFRNVYAMYNADPADDPGGPGTAPGNRFTVEVLRALDDAPDGQHGEITFPTFLDPVEGLQLREDVPNELFGTPRDLSGDSIIDAADHSGDYFFLPVRVVVRWRGRTGRQELSLGTQLCQFRKVGQ